MAPNKTSLALLFVDKKTVVVGLIVLIAAFTLGILIGYFGRGDRKNFDSLEDGILERYTTDQFKDNQVDKLLQTLCSAKVKVLFIYFEIWSLLTISNNYQFSSGNDKTSNNGCQ